jgi:MoaA/NifB/PqqE/SkfB family radical SAM enzyme
MMNNRTRPHWAPDLLSFFVQRLVRRQRIPLFASFKLTYCCNLSCLACPFHRRADEEGASITWEGAIRALDELQERGTRIVSFEGGEPFLWKDSGRGLRELVEEAKKRFLRVAVTTNGTFGLDVPTDVIWVSLDGMKEMHDRLRSGSFDRVWENLKTAPIHRGAPRIMIHFTMNRLNWRELEPLAAALKDIPAVRGITLQLFYPYGRGESDLALSNKERRTALENAIRLKKSFNIVNSARCLERMIRNDWTCQDDLLINVDPSGRVTQGCYVRGRGNVDCRQCGFTPVAEASAALAFHPGSILAGWRAYLA